ncbi:MAG TPA: ABC transporter permease [Streptosporangiaceae bacterium]
MSEDTARQAAPAARPPARSATAGQPLTGAAARRPGGGLRGLASRRPVLAFLVRRVSAGIGTLLVVSVLIYGAVQVLPGDVAAIVLGRTATPARVAALRVSLHLDRPVPERFLAWLTGMLTGHLGDSTAALAQGTTLPVWLDIRGPLGNSMVLAGVTMALFIPLCLILGTWAALRAGRVSDHVISLSALSFSALPEFLVGTLLIVVFFTELNLLPPIASISPGQTPFTHPANLVLPVATLLGISTAFGTRLLRASVVEVLGEDYVAMARLNGLRERRVIWRYALRNALGPSIQVIAQMIQYLVGGIIITESVFNYPGIGTKLVQAVLVRDPQEVSVIAAILAAFYILVNILADLAVVLVVPRLRTRL